MNQGTLRHRWLAAPLVAALSLVFAATATAVTRDVAVGGADAGDCSGAPCATVGYAAGQANGGDTIQVGPGTFTGSGEVVVDENLTLNGAGKTQTVLRPGFDTALGGQWFNVTDGHDFDVNDLTFDGNGDGGDQVHFAIRYFGSSSGAIDSVGFEDVTGASQYLGIAVTTNKGGPPDPSSVDLDITNSTFQDIQRVGVLYKGADVTGTFSGNTYVGKGSGDFLDYALDISAGADIDVTGNTVTDSRGVAASDGSTSAAYLVSTFWGPSTDATFTGNTIADNTAGLHVGFDEFDASAVSAAGNRIVGNDDGVVTTSADVDAQNNWWGCNAGPGNPGCDSVDSRDGGAIDTDPRLVLGASSSPASIETGGQTSQVTADVSKNSAGNTVGAGALNGLAVGFATDLGSVSPASQQISGGTAATTLTSGATPGTASVTATLDNQNVGTQVSITEPPPPPPPPDDPGTGTGGDDVIGGTDGNDVLDGLGGDDDLFGDLGDDLIDGGEGNDLLDGGQGDDDVIGGEGDDDVNGGQGGDEVRGGVGNDDLSGGQGDDEVKGGQGDDQISGGQGEDDIGGGSGSDTVDAHDGDQDTVRCGPDEDTLDADGKDEYGPNCENVS